MVTIRTIKGKDLKGKKLAKVIARDNTGCNKFKYKIGLNTDIRTLNINDQFGSGLYFVEAKDAKVYKAHGTNLAFIEVDDDEKIVEIREVDEDNIEHISYRAHQITITKIVNNFKVKDIR